MTDSLDLQNWVAEESIACVAGALGVETGSDIDHGRSSTLAVSSRRSTSRREATVAPRSVATSPATCRILVDRRAESCSVRVILSAKTIALGRLPRTDRTTGEWVLRMICAGSSSASSVSATSLSSSATSLPGKMPFSGSSWAMTEPARADRRKVKNPSSRSPPTIPVSSLRIDDNQECRYRSRSAAN